MRLAATTLAIWCSNASSRTFRPGGFHRLTLVTDLAAHFIATLQLLILARRTLRHLLLSRSTGPAH
jgi:hypothetical protein